MRAVALSLLSSMSLLGCTAQPVLPLLSPADATQVQLENVKEVPIRRQPISGDRVVCRYVTPTGSHLRRRECYTVRQRAQEAAEAQEWLRSGGQRGAVTLADPLSR